MTFLLGAAASALFFTSSISSINAPRVALELSSLEPSRLEPREFSAPFELLEQVIYYCDEQGVPVWLACRLFSVESSASGKPEDPGWRTDAISWADARGVGQLLSSNLKEFSRLFNDNVEIDPHDAKTNIKVSIRYLGYLHRITGSWKLALMSYHGGVWHFLNPKKYGPFKQESESYARKILGR